MKRRTWGTAVVTLASSMLMFTVVTNAETASDKAPEIQPKESNGMKVLFDNTHAQTAGAADWVIDGAFSDFGEDLASRGYFVKELRKETPITLEDLKEYNVFVVPEANVPYKVSEQQAIEEYVSQGGAIFYISDHYNADRNKNRIDASEAFNGYRRGAFEDMTKDMNEDEKNSEAMQGVKSSDWLNETFGVRFRYNGLDNIPVGSKWIKEDAFNILDGVNGVGLHAGSTIAIMDPTIAKGLIYPPEGLTSAVNKWKPAVDEGVYDGGGVAEGAYIAISKKGKGKAAFVGDTSMVEDASPKYMRDENGKAKRTYDGYKEQDDAKVLTQLIDWLSNQEDYDTFDKMGIQLSSKTVLKDWEEPAKSTEPQKEPWSAPAAHYKWYDSSTFASGSFGSKEAPAAQISTSVSYEATPEAGKTNVATIKMSGLKPNETKEGYRLGVYTPIAQHGFTQGSQVGKVSIGSAELPKDIGYSNRFAVTADAKGNAEQQVAFFVENDGTYNIRIQFNKDNILTESLVIEPAGSVKPTDPTEPETPNTGNEKEASYNVKGQISFEANDDIVKPVDPENPDQELTPVNPDGSINEGTAGGLLSVDYASSFSFGKQQVDTKNRLYGAEAQRFKDSDVLRGNYIQVTDKRGTQSGWVLSVVQNEQFKTVKNEELLGAKLYLGNGALNSPSMLEEGFNPVVTPEQLVKALAIKENNVSGGLELIPGQSSIVMTANQGKGMGTWTLSYGQSKDGNIGLIGANDPLKSSVILSVPSTANPLPTKYETVLTYRLSMVPAP